jgi:hypothetical protein
LKTRIVVVAALPSATAALSHGALADDQAAEAELVQKLQNPVANLISAPLQNNWDFGIGPANAMRYTGTLQPAIPISSAIIGTSSPARSFQ